MRNLAAMLFLWSLVQPAYADNIGELFWEGASIEPPEEGRYLLLPSVPIGGKAKPDAVLMAVIDSGVASKHPQLAGYLIESVDFTGEGPEDFLGHGTAVALIGLFGHGKAESSGAILSAKVVNRAGKIQEEHVIRALEWANSKGARTVNLSLGFRGTREEHKALCDTIERYSEMLFFAAAGNSGPNVEIYPAQCGSPNLIAVAAATPSGKLEPYSGRGDVAAPTGTLFAKEWRYHYDWGQRLAREGKFDEARASYERSLSIEPNPESEFQIGVMDLHEEAVDNAIKRFRRAIQLQPAIAEAHEHLGSAWFLKEEYRKAERSLREAIVLYGDKPATIRQCARAHFNLGMTLLKLERTNEARAEFLETKRLYPKYPRIDRVLQDLESK